MVSTRRTPRKDRSPSPAPLPDGGSSRRRSTRKFTPSRKKRLNREQEVAAGGRSPSPSPRSRPTSTPPPEAVDGWKTEWSEKFGEWCATRPQRASHPPARATQAPKPLPPRARCPVLDMVSLTAGWGGGAQVLVAQGDDAGLMVRLRPSLALRPRAPARARPATHPLRARRLHPVTGSAATIAAACTSPDVSRRV